MKKAIVLLGLVSLLMVACNEEKKVEAKKQPAEPAATTAPAPKPAPAAKPEPKETPKGAPVVVFQTTAGDFEIQMNPAKAPKTVENFLTYVKQGHYDDTMFHRTMKGFMIQGGGFTPDGKQKPTNKPIVNESKNGLKNLRGTISMARLDHPDSATSQFFINHKNNAMLDYGVKVAIGPDGMPRKYENPGYCVFGKIIKGMDVVDKIAEAPTKPSPHNPRERSRPVKPVVVKKAYIK